MIGEGIHSANQRRHNYVRENVEVGFFTDPTVCIGCKACEVACKEWNNVPDDGFVWSGNSYDNTGHLGASTWRHVMFVEQDRQKGNQIVGSTSNGEDPFAGSFSRTFASIARKQVVSKHVRPARLFVLKRELFLCRTISAMAAVIALCRVHSASSIAEPSRCPRPEAPSNARFVTIDKEADLFQRARKFVRPNRSSLVDSMTCEPEPRSVCNTYRKTVIATRRFTIRRKLPSVVFMLSFFC